MGVCLAIRLEGPPAEVILLRRLVAGEGAGDGDFCVAGNFIWLFWQITQAPLQLNSTNVLSWRPYLMASADKSFVCYHSLSWLHVYFLRLGTQMFLRT